jgi:hypothetical protein
MVGDYFLGELTGFRLSGFYLSFIIPAGAIIVGMLAGSGYCLFSWMSGMRVKRQLLWAIAGLQLIAYAAGQYGEYVHIDPRYDDGSPVDFLTYFDFVTQQFGMQGRHGSSGPLGLWGYGIRALEMLGFVVGGIGPLLILSRKRYCDSCQRYLRSMTLGMIAAGVKLPKLRLRHGPTAAQSAEDEAAATNAQQEFESLQAAATGGGR